MTPNDASTPQVWEDLAQMSVQTPMSPRGGRVQHGGAVGKRCVQRRIGESPRTWAGQGLNPKDPRQVEEPWDQC